MSMTTVLKNKETGKIVSFITEQYMLGLYVAVYTKGVTIPEQTGSTLSEFEYHKTLRQNAMKEKHIEFLKDESSALNSSEVIAKLAKFAEAYAIEHKWNFIKDDRGIGFNTHQLAVLHGLPEWADIQATLSWL